MRSLVATSAQTLGLAKYRLTRAFPAMEEKMGTISFP